MKLIGSGGLVGALLCLIWVVGNRLVGAIDRVGTKLEEHTKVDLEAHGELRDHVVAANAELREEIVVLSTKVNTILRLEGDTEPPPTKRGGTPIRGVPIERSMPYSHVRKPTEGK
jgi:hypothetical protein